jgi:hypothetical protein
MLNTKPHTVTRVVDGEAITLVFYPDTGCLRFIHARGVCHELRPPHSWLAMSAAARGVCRGTQATTDGLSILLNDFCAKRARWLNVAQRTQAYEPARCAAPDAVREAAQPATGDFAEWRVQVTA